MRIRFHIRNSEGQLLETTEWQEELARDTAVTVVKSLRSLHGPEARITVERSGVEPTVNPTQVRFRIDDGDNYIYYSQLFPIGEKDSRLAEMRSKYPKATITAQETR